MTLRSDKSFRRMNRASGDDLRFRRAGPLQKNELSFNRTDGGSGKRATLQKMQETRREPPLQTERRERASSSVETRGEHCGSASSAFGETQVTKRTELLGGTRQNGLVVRILLEFDSDSRNASNKVHFSLKAGIEHLFDLFSSSS